MNDFQDQVASAATRIGERMRSSPSDGLLLASFRTLFGGFLLLWVRAIYMPILSRLHRPARWLARLLTDHPTEEDIYWLGVDLYKLLVTAIAVVLYLLVWGSHQAQRWERIGAGFATAFVLIRLIEYVATVGLHFFSRPSQSLASFRPIANAFWSYIEFAILFGMLFESICVFDPGAIASSSNEHLLDSLLGPIYLSFTTLATIGCDFTPRSPLARLAAMSEFFVGLFLIVAIIQKAIARTT